MQTRPLAFCVHLLTATGAALALLAMVAATNRDWQLMFVWLGIALMVDGIDGPLARKFDTKRNAANWDGNILDLVIDFLTYVFIPAYALIYAGLLPPFWGLAGALLITLTGVVYFADVRMKSEDNSFSGFPGVFHMPLLVLLVLQPPAWVTWFLVVVLSLAQFVSLKFIHPVRTERWRRLSLSVLSVWMGLSAWAIWSDFSLPPLLRTALLVTSLYLLLVGIVMQLLPEKEREPASV